MSQQTNLNVSPYFDDFDQDKNYYRILFKPGYPVQARELTGLQSILQNQIDSFGQHFFKEGAKVIPGNTKYERQYYSLEINNTHLGVPVELYIEQVVGKRIIGQTSGVTAVVDKILSSEESERGNTTLYVSYMSSSISDKQSGRFLDGEFLSLDSDVIATELNENFIPQGEPFASTIPLNANSIGSAYSVSSGIYFIRGHFVNVEDETLILSQYTNTPSGRIGFRIREEIINSDEDESLTDNSKGFNNYAAPGADRLKISVSLAIKPLTDLNDADFVELAVVKSGVLTQQIKNTLYDVIGDEFARRTFEESGNYVVKNFDISVKESLNDGLNNGVFSDGQVTYGGSVPNENLALYAISPGKAYIQGYETEIQAPTYFDIPKPRTTKTLKNQSINYNTGSTLKLNRVFGSAQIGIGNTYILSLRDSRIGINSITAPGEEIGVARVYDFALESGSYSFSNTNINEWDITLYDIQTITKITLNEPITLSVPTHVRGKYTNSTGFLKDAVNDSTSLVLYDTKGQFGKNEPFIFDGIENSRISVAVTSYSLSDVKSVYAGPALGNVGFSKTFTADVIQEDGFFVGIATVTPYDIVSGISTIVSVNPLFPGNLIKVNDLIKYNAGGSPDPNFAKVVGVALTSNTHGAHIKVVGVTSVTGVVDGGLPEGATNLSVSNLVTLKPSLNFSADNTLYTPMPRKYVESVSLLNSQLNIRKSYTVNIVGNQLSTPLVAGDNETFLPFDEEDYILIRSDGNTEVLTEDKFEFTPGSSVLQIYNLGGNDTGATLTATLRKINPKAKIKLKNRINSINITNSKYSSSGVGATTLNDGLQFGNYPFGTRVQDERISLNVPDVLNILGVFESVDTSNPSAPKITLTGISSPTSKTTDLIVGERIVGSSSGAIAIYAERLSDTQISCIFINETNFNEGEVLNFKESGYQAILSKLEVISNNVSSHFTFNNGQNGSFYNYGFITRKSSFNEPSKKLKIYFSNAYYESTDDGDITLANSYNSLNYTNDIQSINGIRNTDIIDIRPRVSNYTIAEGVRSPLEFYGRLFNSIGNSASNILASDKSIITDFSFYLGRIDRVFLSPTGIVQVQFGEPSEKAQPPIGIDGSLELGSVNLPPYLFNPSDVKVSFLEHKRYQMKDVAKLEQRIKNLEYYTSLSLLETNTENLFIPDSEGLNQFKSGFFVDNFSSNLTQENNIKINNSIDTSNNELRARHYTTSIDLIPGPVSGANISDDLRFENVEGINVRRHLDNTVTLNYAEVEYLAQPFATRSESVTPFLVSFWSGILFLDPQSDTWLDSVRIDAKVIQEEGNYTDTLQLLGINSQTGLGPIIWDAPQTTWTGQTTQQFTTQRTETDVSLGSALATDVDLNIGGFGQSATISSTNTLTTQLTSTDTTIQDTFTNTFRTGTETRNGVRALVTETFDQRSAGDKIVKRDVILFMRSRNITFIGSQLKPQAEVYAFFDGINVTKYCTPKLLEINMVSGTFQVGETVVGQVPNKTNRNIDPYIQFRVARPDHREGPFNNPSKIYKSNPYTTILSTAIQDFYQIEGTASIQTQANAIPSTYSSTSTILNIDLLSLSSQPQGSFFGYVESGMVLRGETSGAIASVTNKSLIVDFSSRILGSFYIPNPNFSSNLNFSTGEKSFILSDNRNNFRNPVDTSANATFISSGTLETVQEEIISVRNAQIRYVETSDTRTVQEFVGTQLTDSRVISQNVSIDTDVVVSQDSDSALLPPAPVIPPPIINNITNITQNITQNVTRIDFNRVPQVDPIAQTFFIGEPSGVYVTGVDVYFEQVDTMDIPVIFQLRSVREGYPVEFAIPGSEIVIDPDDIITSTDGSIPTRISLPQPVYLKGGLDYSMVLISKSTKYRVFISRVYENDLITDEYVSTQPTLGSLFKSQNASTWEASQWEDLKFNLYVASFLSSGTVEFYNPILGEGNGQLPLLPKDSVSVSSRQIRVGLGSTVQDNNLQLGNTVFQQGTNATGNLIGKAGIATASLGIINAGIGYTPSNGTYTFTGVALTSITGFGKNIKADIQITNGSVSSATVAESGSGYQTGDVLGIISIGNVDVGLNARLSVVSIASTNLLVLDNVQGDFVIAGTAKTVGYINSLGISTTLNGANNVGGNVQISDIDVVNDGLHLKINHENHGMHHELNRVTISEVLSDVIPTKLSLDYSATSTAAISVENSSDFSTFENVAVGATNPGYLKIGEEIIEYTSVSSGTISGITRGQNSRSYTTGEFVYKYEFDGVSLRRINKTHLLSDVTISNPITFDSYHVKLDMSSDGIDRTSGVSFPKLYLNQTKSSGGNIMKASQNSQFEIVKPMIHNTTVPGTSVSGQIRTVSGTNLNDGAGTSVDVPFVDQGFENVTLNEPNYLSSPRIIASRINETSNSAFNQFPGFKSFGMRLTLETTNSFVSPVIDLERTNIVLTSNRINNPISNYITDNRVNSLFEDPTACTYISRENVLKTPATSIKVLLNAHINQYSDIRVYYAISDSQNFDPIFIPFPGYDNLNARGEIIQIENSDGTPDSFVSKSDANSFFARDLAYKEYTFTVSNLPAFKSYRIKISLTSSNQAYVPRIRDLRTICLA